MTPHTRPLAVALVHHANQYLITDGYDNREGISGSVDGYARVLALHEQYGVPAHLHLSGTLLEAVAWHRPEFLDLVRNLAANGLLSLLGGTYAENVMPLSSDEVNRRQIEEFFVVHHELLGGAPPEELRGFWIPERVWDTERLAPLLTRDDLPNGGYRYVLLDDRLLFATNGNHPDSARATFDAQGPYMGRVATPTQLLAEVSRPYRIRGGSGLVFVPLSANLRYWVPPRSDDHWHGLESTVNALKSGRTSLLVYGDDLEKAAGVAGWEPVGDRYEAFLAWLAESRDLHPVLVDDWLGTHPPEEERTIEPGTFFELAQTWKAGEDYTGWATSEDWVPYRRYLDSALTAIRFNERRGADPRLLALAWKHFLASTHETAWRDVDGDRRLLAPWAKALASHSRASIVIASAASHAHMTSDGAYAAKEDVDGDGHDELVLRGSRLQAVVTPNYGGRLVYLFRLTRTGGAMVVGNPTDHWNFQEEMNRFMEIPPNHPGALCDVGCEHDEYVVAITDDAGGEGFAELVNVEPESRLHGARKRLLAPASSPHLIVCYELPDEIETVSVESCLSPDYERLLRAGRRDLVRRGGTSWQGVANGDVAVWVARLPEEGTVWRKPEHVEVGHGLNIRIAGRSHFHLMLGCGDTDDEHCYAVLHEGKRRLHSKAEALVSRASMEVSA